MTDSGWVTLATAAFLSVFASKRLASDKAAVIEEHVRAFRA
jgi:hypothetical protein